LCDASPPEPRKTNTRIYLNPIQCFEFFAQSQRLQRIIEEALSLGEDPPFSIRPYKNGFVDFLEDVPDAF